jgi:hypothetical protein
MIKNESKMMIFCAQGLVEGALRARNAAFWSYFWVFLDPRCAWWLGGCGLGNYWSLEAMGLAKHITKLQNSKKSKSRALVPPSVNSKIFHFFHFSPINHSQNFKSISRA